MIKCRLWKKLKAILEFKVTTDFQIFLWGSFFLETEANSGFFIEKIRRDLPFSLNFQFGPYIIHFLPTLRFCNSIFDKLLISREIYAQI